MNSLPNVSPREKLLLRRFAAGKTDREIAADLGDTENRIVAQRQRIAEKFQVQTHEQVVALASQQALWPGANSQNLKVSGGRDRRRARTIDATEIKKMKAAGMGPSSIARLLKRQLSLPVSTMSQ
jgi:DNA-binding CsgD family transcriptional regulator